MTDRTELRLIAERYADLIDSDDLDSWNEARDIYVDAVSNVSVVLALLAENDRLRTGMKGDYDLDGWLEWTAGRDQLKHDHDKWESLYRNEHATGTRLLDTLTGFRTENDRLKAEVARSTEREILQLAEIEALRKKVGRARVVAIPARSDPKYWESFPELEGGPDFNGCRYVSDLLAALKADGITVSEVLP